MGLLVDGQWQDKWYDTKSSAGRFERAEANFRSQISASGETGFRAEPNRYHLYISLACPWASRTLIVRKLKRLEDVIAVSIVAPEWGQEGWQFAPERGGTIDPIHNSENLHELYTRAVPSFTGRVTVPILWDTQTSTIVNNESSEIIRMLNSEFDAFGDATLDLYPNALRAEIDEVNARVYETVNNGVYRAGFATTQPAYEEAFDKLFATLDCLDARLASRRYLLGEEITEADWRLFVTLVRFDAVYVGHFKCNLRRIVDYPNLWRYTRELYQVGGIAETVDLDHIKRHYYGSHPTINPSGIVPTGPAIDFSTAHGREAPRPGSTSKQSN